MNRYFVGEDGRPLALWRLLIFAILFAAMTAGVVFGVRALLGGLPQGSVQQLFAAALGATIAVFLARKLLDKKTIVSLGLQPSASLADLLFGFLLSSAIMAAFFAVTLSQGYIRYEGLSWWGGGAPHSVSDLAPLAISVGILLAQFGLVGWWEELVFRGYVLQNLSEGVGRVWAVILCCALFGLAHAFNPHATILSDVIIAISTLQLIYAYFATGNLWLSIGLHWGWDFTQVGIFGFATDNIYPSLVHQTPIAPDWLSGGEFGPEASVILAPIMLLSFGGIYLYARARKQSTVAGAYHRN